MTQKETIQKQKNEIDRLGDIINDLQDETVALHNEIHELKYQYDEQYKKEFDTQLPDDLPF